MRSEPVYQPTTTSLDAPSSGVVLGSAAHHHRGGAGSRSWLPPLTYDPLLTSHGPKGSSWPRSLLLVLALLFAVMGLVMIIVGATSYRALLVRTGEGINEEGGGGGEGDEGKGAEGTENEEITADGAEGGGGGRGDGRAGNATAYILVLCLGILLEVAALGSLWAYFRYMGYYLPCWPGKISRIRRRLHAHNTRSAVFNGQQMTSAGTPVSAQYCPPASPPLVTGGPGTGVGEHAPTRTLPAPPYTDGSEVEHLIAMEEEGKVELSDDTERIFDEDPRIVLTPLKNREEC